MGHWAGIFGCNGRAAQKETIDMNHIVLLGDSIFDNAPYVPSGTAVIHHLKQKMPDGWQATLRAVDGSVIEDVRAQLDALPSDATHIVVSMGGNDVLGQAGILLEPAQSVVEVLLRFAQISAVFERNYRDVLAAILQRGLPTTICTIYNPRFDDPMQQQVAETALRIFNDCILRAGFEAGTGIIELRLVCTAYEDYANDIEPSAVGGEKIAQAILDAVQSRELPDHNDVSRCIVTSGKRVS
jgi:lysophospholipase L1-like esterase